MSALESTTITTAASKHPREEAGSLAEAKKARVDTNDTTRDGEFWYEDGSIILEARNVQFRVFKGILADHSSVFADMFSFPQPPSYAAEAAVPDCPVVHLDDSPEDLRHILRALLPRKQASFIAAEPTEASFHEISAYARLGHKYQMDELLHQAIDFLKRYYTNDFDTWYARQLCAPPGNGWYIEHAIGVVNIARLVGCDSILPPALLLCCVLASGSLYDEIDVGVKELLAGFQREDGTRENLSDEDLTLCIAALGTLAQASTGALLAVFVPFSAEGGKCDSPEICRYGVLGLLHRYSDTPHIVANVDPFCEWSAYINIWRNDPEMSICNQCMDSLQQQFCAKQRKLWSRLPGLLGIKVNRWPDMNSEEGR